MLIGLVPDSSPSEDHRWAEREGEASRRRARRAYRPRQPRPQRPATNMTALTTDVPPGSRAYRPSQPGPAARTLAEARKPPKAPTARTRRRNGGNSVRLWGQRFERGRGALPRQSLTRCRFGLPTAVIFHCSSPTKQKTGRRQGPGPDVCCGPRCFHPAAAAPSATASATVRSLRQALAE